MNKKHSSFTFYRKNHYLIHYYLSLPNFYLCYLDLTSIPRHFLFLQIFFNIVLIRSTNIYLHSQLRPRTFIVPRKLTRLSRVIDTYFRIELEITDEFELTMALRRANA